MKPLDLIGFFFLTNSNIYGAGPADAFHITVQFVYMALAAVSWFVAWRLK